MTALTETAIEAARKRAIATDSRIELSDAGTGSEPGLVLRISPDKAMWSVRAVLPTGKRVRAPLAEYGNGADDLGIKEARVAARETKAKAKGGSDVSPVAVREAAREADRMRVSVAQLLENYAMQKLKHHRSGDLARRSIEKLLGEALKGEPSGLTRAKLAMLLDQRAIEAPVAANRALGYARPFLRWMVQRGHLEFNPLRDFEKPTREKPRERVPSLDEIAEIWRASDRIGYPFGHFIKLAILLAGRRDEIANITVDELELDADGGAIWTLPTSRSKNGRAFRVPLPDEAVDIMRDAIARKPADCAFIMTTNGRSPISAWSQFKTKLDDFINGTRESEARARGRKFAPMEPFVMHDFRRSFATVAIDKLHLDPAIVDRCLNHVAAGSSSVVARVYQRSEMIDQRRTALTAWARLVGEKVGLNVLSNVVPLRGT